jgi:uncharacterized protein YcbK (DUF882 family)
MALAISAGSATAQARNVGIEGGAGLNSKLVSLLWQVSQKFGKPVIVSSGCRTSHGNRRAGGAKHSLHLRCLAADIKVSGISKSQVLRAVMNLPGRGGVGTYCRNSVVHLDVGDPRTWHESCGRSFAKRNAPRRGKPTQVASR